MSALAKVFVVFVFILSVAFFGTSATLFKTRHDWKSAYLEYKKTVHEAVYGESGLGKRIDELVTTVTAKQADIALLESDQNRLAKENKQLASDVSAKTALVEKANSDMATANALSTTLANTLKSEKDAHSKLQELFEKAKADYDTAATNAAAANKDRDIMRLDLEKALTELHVARTEYKALSDKHDTDSLRLAAFERAYPEARIAGPVPAIEALINAVEPEERLVVLSVGKDDKVEPGFEFTIYRGNQYIGKVKVIKVYPNLSGARIITTKDGQEIQRGDKASTAIGSS